MTDSAQPEDRPSEMAWAEEMINRWSPDGQSQRVEQRARELAGPNHKHGAIPARFWRAAVVEFATTSLLAALPAAQPPAVTRPGTPEPDSVEYQVAVRIARNRFGPGVDMGGQHNPRPSEWRLAREIVEDVRAEARRDSAGLDVERLHMAADHMNVAHQRWVWEKVAAEYRRLSGSEGDGE